MKCHALSSLKIEVSAVASHIQGVNQLKSQFTVIEIIDNYHISLKYWDTFNPYHTCPKI